MCVAQEDACLTHLLDHIKAHTPDVNITALMYDGAILSLPPLGSNGTHVQRALELSNQARNVDVVANPWAVTSGAGSDTCGFV